MDHESFTIQTEQVSGHLQNIDMLAESVKDFSDLLWICSRR